MKNYEITFIVDPVLSGDEIKGTAQTYVDRLKNEGCRIVHVDEMGLRQLAYPINKRTSGVYYCVEFEAPSGGLIAAYELALRRDERIMRFLTARLDKYGVKYNADKRAGLIGKVKKKKKEEKPDRRRDRNRSRRPDQRRREPRKEEPKKATEAVVEKSEPEKTKPDVKTTEVVADAGASKETKPDAVVEAPKVEAPVAEPTVDAESKETKE